MMKTQQLYLQDSYLKTSSAKISQIVQVGNETAVILDKTIFYAQGGGQPADHGLIQGPNGKFFVTHVSYNNGEILHKGHIEGTLETADEVELKIDWERRYQYMQSHTAGHIVDQAVKNTIPDANAVDGNHGLSKKMYIEFTNQIPQEKLKDIEVEANKIIADNLPITTEMVTYDELIKKNIKLPFDLPNNKDLRIVQIGQFPAMPDGGTQLKTTGECWHIKISEVIEKDGKWRVVYDVQNPNQQHTQQDTTKQPTNRLTDQLPLPELEQRIKDIVSQLESETELSGEELRIKYLGKKGLFTELAKTIKEVEDKKQAGQLLNDLKQQIEQKIIDQPTKRPTNQPSTDLTIPGYDLKIGHIHPVSQAIKEITDIFEKIGFTRVRYPEVDGDYYVFESLNMPPDHPARDEWETFFVDVPKDPQLGEIVLSTHTSNGQVREMERLGKPPIRMINIARCYRRQSDVTHTPMFHQFEGLVVDKGITIQHLKGTIDHFAREFYGPGAKSRIRPFHFQFTEPSFEVDFSCSICNGTGYVEGQGARSKVKEEKDQSTTNSTDQPTNRIQCRFCKSGWHEVGGAGMVHPNVLKAGGIDPEEYTGFAFGWGIERTYTLRPDLHIDDIRMLYNGDLRLLEQF